jgi:hypothetical protein
MGHRVIALSIRSWPSRASARAADAVRCADCADYRKRWESAWIRFQANLPRPERISALNRKHGPCHRPATSSTPTDLRRKAQTGSVLTNIREDAVNRPGKSGDSTSWERPRGFAPSMEWEIVCRSSFSCGVSESTIGGCVSRSTPIFLWCCEPVWERGGEVGRFLVLLRDPWIVASNTCRKVLYLLASPRCARRQRISRANGRGGQGGSGASAVCGY